MITFFEMSRLSTATFTAKRLDLPSKKFLERYSIRITALPGSRGVENRERSDLLSDDVPIKAARSILEIGAYASDEMRAAASRACHEIFQNFEARSFERRRARSHLPRLRVLSSGRGIVFLSGVKRKIRLCVTIQLRVLRVQLV